MLNPEEVILGVCVNGSDGVVSIIEGLTIFVGFDEFAIFGNDFISLLFDLIQRALDFLTVFQPFDITFNVAVGDVRIGQPAALIMIPAAAAGYIKPRIFGFFILCQPIFSILCFLKFSDLIFRRLVTLENSGNFLGRSCQFGKAAKFFFRLEHGYIGAGDHLTDGTFTDTGKKLAGHIGKHQIGQVSEVQHLEMILPALKHLIDQLVKGLDQIVTVVHPGGRRQNLIIGNIFRQLAGDSHRGHFFTKRFKLGQPFVPKLIIMFKYIEYAFFKMSGFLTDDFLRWRGDGADVHITSHHSLGDSLGRWNTEYAGGVL